MREFTLFVIFFLINNRVIHNFERFHLTNNNRLNIFGEIIKQRNHSRYSQLVNPSTSLMVQMGLILLISQFYRIESNFKLNFLCAMRYAV